MPLNGEVIKWTLKQNPRDSRSQIVLIQQRGLDRVPVATWVPGPNRGGSMLDDDIFLDFQLHPGLLCPKFRLLHSLQTI